MLSAPAAVPVQVRRGRAKVGGREEAGDDLAVLFVQPRPGSDTALVGAVSGIGLASLYGWLWALVLPGG